MATLARLKPFKCQLQVQHETTALPMRVSDSVNCVMQERPCTRNNHRTSMVMWISEEVSGFICTAKNTL